MKHQTKFAGNGISRTAMIFKIASMGGNFNDTSDELD